MAQHYDSTYVRVTFDFAGGLVPRASLLRGRVYGWLGAGAGDVKIFDVNRFYPLSSQAQARLARRHAGRAVRSDTLLSTVQSIQRGDFPTRRAAAARAAPSTPRLVSAARVGPVVYGLLLTFRGGGYG